MSLYAGLTHFRFAFFATQSFTLIWLTASTRRELVSIALDELVEGQHSLGQAGTLAAAPHGPSQRSLAVVQEQRLRRERELDAFVSEALVDLKIDGLLDIHIQVVVRIHDKVDRFEIEREVSV